METLKANELRIGNWVKYYKGESTGEILGMTFSVFSKNNKVAVSIEPPEDTGWTQTSLDDLQPIPITEEWLVKLGFEKEYNFFQKYLSDIESLSWSEESGLALHRRRIGNTHIFRHIKHVHTLQNLVHALTGNELTIKS